jgi:MFS transporter, PPP family, 3-phenylpropionic acid transporter
MTVPLRLAANYFALFWVFGIYVPFLPAWLEGRGFTGEQIGLILAAAMWGKVIANTVLGARADASGNRKAILVGIAMVVLAGYVAFLALQDRWLVAILCAIVGTVLTSAIPMSDNLTLLAVKRIGIDYGRVRLWASLAFIAASAGGGWFLGGRGAETILYLLIGGAAAMLATTLLLPSIRTPPRVSRKSAMVEVLRLPGFKPFALAASLLLSSHAALYGFATIRWLDAGIAGGTIGLLWAEGVIIEVGVFAFATRLLGRFRISTLFLFVAAVAAIRWTAIGLTTALPVLVAAQALHAVTFAVTHIAAQTYILNRVPETQSASAQGLYDALSMGLFFGLATLLAGWLFEMSGGLAFLSMVPGVGLAAVAALALRRHC